MIQILSIFTLAFALGACGIRSIPTQKNAVDAAWAEVLNQYKRRADLIPNIVEVTKGYAKHERETLTAVVVARSNATKMEVDASKLNEESMAKFQQAQQQLSGALSRLMLVVERYPELKANQHYRDLQVQLEGTENRIGVARTRYIEEIQKFNNLVTVFPTSLTNSLFFRHEKMPQFAVENEQQIAEPPKVEM